uniref:AAA family ATPase n=1 Tax=Desulfacinum infernum TaxID=35837 RepID=A0A832A316_9BACT
MPIDYGQCVVGIGEERVRVHLFVATLGYSRRSFVMAFLHERRSSWLTGIEGSFRYFGGVPQEILFDNARALVERHDPLTREVLFNERFHAFCRSWGVTPKACAPYRARTKGKGENKDHRRLHMGMSLAKFPFVRTLDGCDFTAQPTVDAKQIRELATGRWIAHGDALLLLGPPGVGKTHLAVALGREAIARGFSVLCTSAAALMTALQPCDQHRRRQLSAT